MDETGETIARRKATRERFLLGAVIVVAALAAYHNSFSGPFVFDDASSITGNPSIRELWPVWSALSPPSGGLTVSGRPIVNLSLAVNYALGGTNVRGYHAGNLLIHILAALTLFGVMRRTLDGKRGTSSERGMGFQPMFGDEHGLEAHATFLAFAVALLWTVHPLQTEAVTYVVQRAESLMALFYLLTLYCAIRGMKVDEAFRLVRGGTRQNASSTFKAIRPLAWSGLSVAACFLGMATKEVMVSAPVIVFLYDRCFVSGSFRAAWRRHRALHACLAGTWILLGFLVASTHARGGTSGFATGIPWWKYTLTQFPAVVNYLRLSVVPAPLVFDYGSEWLPSPWAALPYAAVVGLLIAGVVWALLRPAKRDFGGQGLSCPALRDKRALGFAGAFFFAILAPTSIVPEVRQTMAEHRMYLALAPVLAVIVVGGYAGCERLVRQRRRCVPLRPDDETRRYAASNFIPLLAVALVFLTLTIQRNNIYRTDLSLWRDTVAKRPDNAYAQTNLGVALLDLGRTAEATARFRRALQLDPLEAQAEYNLGLAMVAGGRTADAIACYERAIEIKPALSDARNNLGVLLTDAGRLPEAIGQLEEAVRLKPDFAAAHMDLGIALAAAGRTDDAIFQYTEALRLDPASPEARSNLGNALRQAGDLTRAVVEYQQALRLKPDYAQAHNNLGVTLAETGRWEEAIEQYEQALTLKPDFADAHKNLGTAYAQVNMLLEAAAQFTAALRADPGDASVHNTLGGVLFRLGRTAESIPEYEAALRLKPDYPEACANLGVALANAGRMPEAIAQLTRAVELKPDYAEAQSNLAVALAASGRLAESIYHYRAALRIEPDNPDIHANFAAALQQAGHTEEAETELSEAAHLRGK